MKNNNYGEQFENILNKGVSGGARAGAGLVSKGIRSGVAIGKKTARMAGNTIRQGFHISASTTTGGLLVSNPVGWIIIVVLVIIFIIVAALLFIYISYAILNSNGTVGYGDSNSANLDFHVGSYEASVEDLSDENCAVRSYYEIMANYSVLQPLMNENGDIETDENGEVIYISAFDKRAKKDAFNRDQDLKIDYNIIFSLDRKLFGDKTSYPEAFLKPVAHTKDYKLSNILDENGRLNKDIQSVNKKTGLPENSVADYGISSLCTYKKIETESVLSGSYIGELWVNNETGEEVVKEISPESFSIPISTSEVYVLDSMVSMNKSVHYQYKETATLQPCDSEKASDESANSKYILVDRNVKSTNPDDTTENKFVAQNKYDYTAPNVSFATQKELDEFLKNNTAYVSYSSSETPSSEGSWTVYKIRSDSSGINVSGITQGDDEIEEYDNTYFYQYLSEFSCYIPKSLRRDPELLSQMNSKGEISAYYHAIKDENTNFTTGSSSMSLNKSYADVNLEENAGEIPDTVLQWTDWVVNRCEAHSDDEVDLTQYVPAILAHLWQESHGIESVKGYKTKRAGDVMQCEESGYLTDDYPADWSRAQASIDAGIRYFKASLLNWSRLSGGLIAPDDIGNMQVVAKGYNAGITRYHAFMVSKGAYGYTEETEKEYNVGHFPYGTEWGAKYLSCLGMSEYITTGSSNKHELKEKDSELFNEYFHAGGF